MPLFGLFGPPNVDRLRRKGDVEGLIKALSYPKDAGVRTDAASAFLYITDARAVEPLFAALKDSDKGVRWFAARALGEKNKDERAIELLISAVKDNDSDVRWIAAYALGKIKDARAVEPLIAALKDSDKDVRKEAARALGRIQDERAVEPLIAVLKDSDKDVRQAAAEALGEIKDARAVEPLIAAQQDSDEKVRSAAAVALGKIKDALKERERIFGTWDELFLQLSMQEGRGTILPPQLILCCQAVSMAARLAEGIPAFAKSLLAGEAEVIEFNNGRAAVRFYIKDGKDILQLINLLGQGNYGTDRLVIKNGIAIGLPVSDRLLFLQSVNTPEIYLVATVDQVGQETFAWW